MITPLVLQVIPDFPAKTVPEFIAYAKANPGKISMAHFGTGTVSHLAAEGFRLATGIEFTYVPYGGSPGMLTDMIGGRVHASFDTILASVEHIKAGRLRALGVSSASRSDTLPDVPTINAFVAGYEVNPTAGIGAPKGTPPEIVATLNREINAALADPKIGGRLIELSAIVIPQSSDDFGKMIARETERWAKLISASGIKVN
jgi:tripartite-type tricarboxylate transporter receptor subunit TctC